MFENKQFESLERFEIFTLVTDEGLKLTSVNNFTVGKKYRIHKETFNPIHSLGMLYTVQDDSGKVRQINSKYFTSPEPKLKEDYYMANYIKDDCDSPADYKITYHTEKNPQLTELPEMPTLRNILKAKTKKSKKVVEEPKSEFVPLEEIVTRMSECEFDNSFDEAKALAGIPVPKKLDALKAMSKTIANLLTDVSELTRKLHNLDKELAVLKKVKVRA